MKTPGKPPEGRHHTTLGSHLSGWLFWRPCTAISSSGRAPEGHGSSICLSTYLTIYQFLRTFMYMISIPPSMFLSVDVSLSISLSISLRLSTYIYIHLHIYICPFIQICTYICIDTPSKQSQTGKCPLTRTSDVLPFQSSVLLVSGSYLTSKRRKSRFQVRSTKSGWCRGQSLRVSEALGGCWRFCVLKSPDLEARGTW